MAGAPAVMTLVVMLRAVLPAVACVGIAATVRTLPSIAVLTRLLLPLLLREKQLAVYARWWQCVILHGTVLRRPQPAADIF
jgi:hypothetical protein